MNKYLNDDKFKKMYSKLKLKKFFPIISEQAFVEKWVMVNNQQEYKESSFIRYFKGQWGIFKSMFISEDDFNEKKEDKKDKKDNKKISEENEINIEQKKK